MVLEDMVNASLQSDFLTSPVYTMLAPLRHYIGGLLFRNAAEKAYQRMSGTMEKLGVLAHPLALFLYSMAPDIDNALGLTHRNETHSLVFAGLVGLVTAGYAVLTKKKHVGAYFALPFAVVTGHVAVDMLIEGGDPMNPLWPMTGKQNVQVHPNYEWIGHVFAIAGLAYMGYYYRKSIRSARERLKKKRIKAM